MIVIGHASIAENGGINGMLGDSTGKEVCTREWYYKNWTHVIRATEGEVAYNIAANMRDACANNNIGYGQSDRLTAYKEYKKAGSIAAISNKCNADCSSLVALCAIASGVNVNPDLWTGTEVQEFKNAGFRIFTSVDYTAKTGNLRIGDILRSDTHTAIVVDDTSASGDNTVKNTVTAKQYALNFNNNKAGTYKVCTPLFLRDGAGIEYEALCVLPEGTPVFNYGYYTSKERNWLYVQAYLNGILYTGFCSEKYLAKMS